jgi:hypothetical protein
MHRRLSFRTWRRQGALQALRERPVAAACNSKASIQHNFGRWNAAQLGEARDHQSMVFPLRDAGDRHGTDATHALDADREAAAVACMADG